MRLNKKGNLEYYTFDNIEKTNMVNHCFSTRLGGVSKGCYESLNLGIHRGDNIESVLKNYDILCSAIGVKKENCVMSKKQVHGTRVERVGRENMGDGILHESPIELTDGLVTNEKDVVLVTFHADCVPLYFVDPENKAIGLSHAGWRGTVNKMAEATILKMTEEFGTKPENIIAGIGPSIGPCCFQVGQEVVDEFNNKLEFAHNFIKEDNVVGKYKIDLWGVNKQIMIDAGVKAENIEIGGVCTMDNPDKFFSHRIMSDQRGSMAAFMSIK